MVREIKSYQSLKIIILEIHEYGENIKVDFFSKIPLWVSPQEAFFGRNATMGDIWLKYKNILMSSQGELRMKTREELYKEGYNCQWFQYVQLMER